MSSETNILIVDDEPIVCDRLGSALEKLGYSIETCTESQCAVRLISQKHYDVVVTDLKMQGLDGLDILKVVKELSPNTRVIIITGFATVEKAREALKVGAYDFIAKPFKLKSLRQLVLKAVEESDSPRHSTNG